MDWILKYIFFVCISISSGLSKIHNLQIKVSWFIYCSRWLCVSRQIPTFYIRVETVEFLYIYNFQSTLEGWTMISAYLRLASILNLTEFSILALFRKIKANRKQKLSWYILTLILICNFFITYCCCESWWHTYTRISKIIYTSMS